MVLGFCLYAWHISGQGNMGFEGGDLSGWKTYKNGLPINPLVLISEKGLMVTSDSMKVNAKVNEPAVCPWGGMNSIRLGFTKSGFNVPAPLGLEREILITEDEYNFNYAISYYYEIHDDMDYYSLQIYDSDSMYYDKKYILDFTHQQYSYIINSNYFNRVQKWKKVSIPLKGLKGKKVKFKFEVRGCLPSGHVAYLFLDFYCNPLNQTLSSYQCANDVLLRMAKPSYNQIYKSNNMFWKSFTGDSLRFYWDQVSPLSVLSFNDTSCAELHNIPLSKAKRFADFEVSMQRCLYDTLQFKNRSTRFAYYEWDYGSAPFIENQNIFERRFTSAGKYNLRLIAKDTFCSDTISKSFEVFNNKHGLQIQGKDLCIGDTALLSSNKNLSIKSLTWDINSVLNNADSIMFKASLGGSFEVKLYSIDSNGCKDTVAKLFVVNRKPDAFFVYQYLGDNMYDFWPLEQTLKNKYTWNIDGNSSNKARLNWELADTISYKIHLHVVNEFGCSNDTFLLLQNKTTTVFVPNAFNPAHGGFKPYTNRVYNYHLEIYNRWGELLFETRNPDEAWDGTYKGEYVQQDVYACFIHYTDAKRKRFLYKDGITVLR
jgi:gliding motility-associated-like protein